MEFSDTPDGVTVRLEGRFVKDFAEHARMLIGKSNAPSRFVVDLSEVTFVDTVGEEVLIWLKELGVRFTADSAYCLDICERLELPMAAERSGRRGAKCRTGRSQARNDHVSMKRNATLTTFSFGEEH